MERKGTSGMDSLTAKQQRAIESLLREPTIQSAAESAQVGKTTIFRWLAEPEFSAAYKQQRGQLLESTLTALQAASVDAVTCLREVLNDKSALVTARVSAARAVLEISLKAKAELETEERLRALEEKLKHTPERKTA